MFGASETSRSCDGDKNQKKYKIMLYEFEIKNETISDESYSKLMLTEGEMTPVDDDINVELPEWADEKKIKM